MFPLTVVPRMAAMSLKVDSVANTTIKGILGALNMDKPNRWGESRNTYIFIYILQQSEFPAIYLWLPPNVKM